MEMSSRHICACLNCICPTRIESPETVCNDCTDGIHASYKGKRY